MTVQELLDKLSEMDPAANIQVADPAEGVTFDVAEIAAAEDGSAQIQIALMS